jgi:hypothetical protein
MSSVYENLGIFRNMFILFGNKSLGEVSVCFSVWEPSGKNLN